MNLVVELVVTGLFLVYAYKQLTPRKVVVSSRALPD